MMIKSLVSFLFVFSFFAKAQTPANFTVTGNLRNVTQKYIYVHHKWDNKDVTDSVKVVKSNFTYTAKTSEANMYWITKANNINEQPNLIFFVDGGKTSVSASIDSLNYGKIQGGKTQKDYQEYNALMMNFGAKQQDMVTRFNDAKAKNDGNAVAAIQAEYQAMDKEVKTSLQQFIKTHSKSAVSGFAIYYNYQNATVAVEELEVVVALLDKSILNTKYGKLAQEKLIQMRGTMIGYTALNFSQADANGKMVKLTDFKGKYVLLDFWASWCGPCRAENPNVVNAYNKYKEKGFTILGVSFDQNKEKWLQAVAADNLAWTHVCDLKGWGNDAAKLYGVSSIPQNYLLDKNGKILAKNLRGAELEAKLEEIFK